MVCKEDEQDTCQGNDWHVWDKYKAEGWSDEWIKGLFKCKSKWPDREWVLEYSGMDGMSFAIGALPNTDPNDDFIQVSRDWVNNDEIDPPEDYDTEWLDGRMQCIHVVQATYTPGQKFG